MPKGIYKRKSGKPPVVRTGTVTCKWGCGEVLGIKGRHAHEKSCKNRPLPVVHDIRARPVTLQDVVESLEDSVSKATEFLKLMKR